MNNNFLDIYINLLETNIKKEKDLVKEGKKDKKNSRLTIYLPKALKILKEFKNKIPECGKKQKCIFYNKVAPVIEPTEETKAILKITQPGKYGKSASDYSLLTEKQKTHYND